MQEKVLLCEDSIEGIFTGIYDAYALRYQPQDTRLQVGGEENLRLFAEYITIKPDEGKTVKVIRTLRRDFGEEAYLNICRALASQDTEKGNAAYQTIAAGFSMKNKRELMGNLANPYVNQIFRLSRHTNNEILHLEGFLRFEELKQGVLFSTITPKNNILTFLAPHFADRLPLENFIIYDKNRELFVVHPTGQEWIIVSGVDIDRLQIGLVTEKEKMYQELFTYFCHKIAIKERENLHLQRQMLPLRFRENMLEFCGKRLEEDGICDEIHIKYVDCT